MKCKIKIRGYHCDAYGHVNNAKYLEFFEEARWQYLEDKGRIAYFLENGLQFFIVNINVNYRKELKPNDLAEITVGIKEHGNTSITFIQELTCNGEKVADALVKFVLYNSRTKQAERIKPEYLEKFK